DRSWPVGFDVTDRQGGGPTQHACFAVVELDGHGGLRDVHGHGLMPVDASEGNLLAGDQDHPRRGGPPLHPDRLGPGAWWRRGWERENGPRRNQLGQVIDT